MTTRLGDRDSNPDSAVQSRVPYHWTISQYREVIGRFGCSPNHRPTIEFQYIDPARPVKANPFTEVGRQVNCWRFTIVSLK